MSEPERDPDGGEDLDAIEELMQRALGGEPLGDVLAGLPSDLAREADVLLDAQSFFAGAAGSRPGAPASPSRPRHPAQGGPPQDGKERVGPYVLIELLGSGGQGEVWLATDERLGRRVALKILHGHASFSGQARKRLLREASVTSRLDHPGICTVHEVGEEGGVPFIAMRFVDGKTVDRWSGSGEGGPPDAEAIRRLVPHFEQAARALHVAHEAGVIHRDVKPGNIMVSESGQAVVLDFGLAGHDDLEASLTRTGDVFGTPAYLSPEQISRGAAGADRRTDVWSLGVALYECLARKRPFAAPTRDALYHQILMKEPEDPRRLNRAISRDLGTVVLCCLAKDRDRRYQTAEALADDLRAVTEGHPVAARPVGPLGRLVRFARRQPTAAALVLVLVLGLPALAVLLTAYVKDRPRVEAQREAEQHQRRDDLLSDAFLELGEGDPKKAMRTFEDALAVDPASTEAVAGLVMAQLGLARPAEALVLLDRHAALLGARRSAVTLRMGALKQSGRDREAEDLARALPVPGDALDHYLLGIQLLQEGERGRAASFPAALEMLERAILLASRPRALFHQQAAHAASHTKDAAAAARIAAAIESHWPRSARCAHQRGLALLLVDRDQAIAAFRGAIALDASLAGAWSDLGLALCRKGEYAEGIAASHKALALQPHRVQPLGTLTLAYLETGDLDRALELGRRNVAVDDGNEAWNALGRVLRAKRNMPEAVEAFRKAVERKPGYATGWSNLGLCLKDQGKIDEAIEACRKATALEPASAEAWNSLGVVYRFANRLDDAVAAYRSAIAVSPRYAHAHANLGSVLREKGDPEGAVQACRTALEIDAGNPVAWYLLGDAFMAQGDGEQATAAFRKAVELKPDYALAWVVLGECLSRRSNSDEAVAALRRGLTLDARNAGAWNVLGGVHLNRDAVHEAFLACRKAMELKPAYAQAWCNSGLALGRLGFHREAVDALRRGHELGSSRPSWSYPSGGWTEDAETRLDASRDAIAEAKAHRDAGTTPPLADLPRLVEAAHADGQVVAAAKWYGDAVARDERLLADRFQVHLRAALRTAIALAMGYGDASRIDEEERARWRELARSWMTRAMAGVPAKVAPGQSAEWPAVLDSLESDPLLASIRQPQSLERLPEAEREAWQKIWADGARLAGKGH